MANRISDLRTANKAGNTSREYVLLSNIDSNSSTKIALNDIFPTLQSGKITAVGVTAGTPGEAPQDLFVGGGVGSSTANTDKSILIFKGLATANLGTNATKVLNVQTNKSTADGTKQNIVFSLNQNAIDLNNADNTSAEFLSETGGKNPLNLSTSAIDGTLIVTKGGTGATTFTDGGLLIGNGTGVIQSTSVFQTASLLVGAGGTSAPNELVVGTNGQVLIADSGAATGLRWGEPTISATTFTGDITTSNNNVILGTGYLKGGTGGGGISLNTSTNYAYIGSGTKYFNNTLNVDGSISLGSSLGNVAQTIKNNNCSSGASPALTIEGSNNLSNSNGGAVNITAGAGQLNAAGGAITIGSGLGAGSGADGSIVLKAGASNALVVDGNNDISVPNGKIVLNTEPLHINSLLAVVQATSLATGVTINTSAGVINLATGQTLGQHDEAEFVVANSQVTTKSIIMLTTGISATGANETNGATLIAQVRDLAMGSFGIRLTNPGNASTSVDHFVNFFIVNGNV